MTLLSGYKIFILTTDEFKQLLLRKRTLFCVLFYLGTLILFLMGISYLREIFIKALMHLETSQRTILEESIKQFSLPLSWIEKYPVLNYPFPFLICFFLSLGLLPFLIPMVSCDMISQDLSRGTQRFILYRVSRFAYFFSKGLAHFIHYFVIQILLFMLGTFYCVFKMKESITLDGIQKGFELQLRLIPIILAFLAMTHLISSLMKSPVKSFLMDQVFLLALFFILIFFPELSLFYGPLWSGLFAGWGLNLAQSVAGFCLWSLAFWGIGFGFFNKKKL